VGGTELFVATLLPFWLAPWFIWAGVGTLWVSFAYWVQNPRLLGKQDAPWLSFIALLPYHLAAQGSARVAAKLMRQTQVALLPGLWVGGWPYRGAAEHAQLDLTAELPRRGTALRYACFPMLDGAPASEQHYLAALTQALLWRDEGLPVLVHCAYGHGRSVAVCIGVLVVEGHFSHWQAAHQHVLRLRPHARMTAKQRQMLDRVEPALLALRAQRQGH